MRRPTAILLTILLFAGCAPDERKGATISEGIITYGVEFPDHESSLLPKEITQTFKDDKFRIEFSVSHGLVRSIFIADFGKQETIILLDMFGSKYATRNSTDIVEAELAKMPSFDIEDQSEIKNIAGYDCNRMLVTGGEDKDSFEIFYTDKIEAEAINWHSPFMDVDGVILEYPINYTLANNQIRMKLSATNIESKKIPKKVFDIPKDYNMVSKKEIDELLDNLMSLMN